MDKMGYKETIEDIIRLEVNAADEKEGRPETWPTLESFREDHRITIYYAIGDLDREAIIVYHNEWLDSFGGENIGSAYVQAGSIVHMVDYVEGEPQVIDLRDDSA